MICKQARRGSQLPSWKEVPRDMSDTLSGRSLEALLFGREFLDVLDAQDADPRLPESIGQLLPKALVIEPGHAALAAGFLAQLV